ncbi:MAG: SgcJ/EcaC family oxidoreductase [Anaerolineae bacterium]|nr:SgcJ/EcaC family oxidoreductase [Gemmatimonadaceae bacterium]
MSRCRHGFAMLLLVLAACATTPRVDPRIDQDAIRELDRRWNQQIAARNAGGVAELYADDGVAMAPNAPPAKGKAAITAANADMMRPENNLSLTFEPTEITVGSAGDVAYDIGTYRFGIDTPGGRITDNGKYITIWKKVDGQWKVAADMFNSDLPMQSPVAAAPAAPAASSTAHGMVAPSELKWTDAPPSLPRGAKVAAIEGNPAEPGPFTMRVMLPDKYRIPPHQHPGVEHVTVISGTFHLGMGERFDAGSGRALTAGSFSYMPARMPHYAWSTGETVVQLHGQGPWGITYVNAADDPRTKP